MIIFFIGVILGGGIVALCAISKIADLRAKIGNLNETLYWLERKIHNED